MIVLWIALVAGCLTWGAQTGVRSISDTNDVIGESGKAFGLVHDAGLDEPPSEVVLVRGATAGEATQAASELQRRLSRLPEVAAVASALPGGGSVASLSADGGRALLVQASIDRGDAVGKTGTAAEEATDAVIAGGAKAVAGAVRGAEQAHPDASFAQTGAGSIDEALDKMTEEDLRNAELLSVPITLLILVLVFGALVAASVPLILGLTAVAATMGAVGPLSQLVPMGESVGPLVVLIGLAVGVDYSLFYVRREREERAAGNSAEASLAAAAASVGRAIVVSGVIVMLALAGLLLTGVSEFTAMAAGTVLVVLIAVIGSLTVLPAMLSLLGDKIDAGRIIGRRRARRERRRRELGFTPAGDRPPGSRAWRSVAGAVTRRPGISLGAATLVLLAIAAPATQMTLGDAGTSSLPQSVPAVRAAIDVDKTFPGGPEVAQLVASGEDLDDAQTQRALLAIGERAQRVTGGVGEPRIEVSNDGTVAVVAVPVPDRGSDASKQLVRDLRAELAGAQLPGGTEQLLVSGRAAESLDFATAVWKAMPLVAAFVLGLALLLLWGTFRSWRLAVSVIALNLLSVAAAYGVMVLVFQHTWAESLLGFTSSGAITTWLPLIAFVILFGLSMDYSILVLERIREERRAGYSPRDAAARGVAATAGTVTGAALVMVGVFSIFATLRMLEMKQLGIGLASAILIDATIIRAFALPAAVTLLGEKAFGSDDAPGAGLGRGGDLDGGEATVWDDRRVPAAVSATRETIDA